MEIYAHKQVETSRKGVHVDEELLPLIEALWKGGYNTQYSCQGGETPGNETKQGGVAQPSLFREMFVYDGAHVFPDDRPSDAHVIFGKFEDGVAFLRYSAIKMGWWSRDDPMLWHDLMVLQVANPLRGQRQPRAMVIWANSLTKKLIEVWCEPQEAQATQEGR